MLRGPFFLKKKEAFPKSKKTLLCLLQNFGGHMPTVPPRFLRLCLIHFPGIRVFNLRCQRFLVRLMHLERSASIQLFINKDQWYGSQRHDF